MNNERWQRITDIFLAVCDEAPDKRSTILDAKCEGDDELKNEVLALLRADVKDATLLDGELQQSINHLFEELPELPAPEHIGSYKVVSEIGRGGMGVVYRVERGDKEYKKSMALKLVKRGMDTDEILTRFRHERQILASLEHPNIARLYDGGATDDGRPYLVMEYVEGETITTYCDNRRLTTDERLRLFITVCKGVRFAHQNLIVHRDLKPSNVMVTNNGDVRLLDFGIAKLLQPSLDEEVPHTGPSMQLITPGYASPEQIDGGNITTASDVYSLGIILYELITGSHPYRGTDGKTLITRHTETHQIESPLLRIGKTHTEENFNARKTTKNALYRRVKNDLNNIVMTALDPDPQNRYQSAEQLLRDLDRHMSGHPVDARPHTIPYRFKKFVGRNKIAAASVPLFLVMAVVFVIFSWVQQVQTTRERDIAQLERDKANEVSGFLQELFRSSNPFAIEPVRLDTVRMRDFLRIGAERIENEFYQQPQIRAQMMHVIGAAYLDLGLFEESEPLLEQSLEIRRDLYNNPHEEIEQSVSSLGTLYHRTGRYDEAMALFNEAIGINKILHGDTHENTAISEHNLAILLHDLGEYDAAETRQRNALSIFRQRLGNEHPRVAFALNGLGTILTQKGKYDASEEVYRESVRIHEKVYGDNHPNVAVALHNLSSALQWLGRLEEAEPPARQALSILRSELGPEHHRVNSVMTHLASILRDMGHYEEAKEYYYESIEHRRNVFGYESFEMTISLSNYADLLRRMGEYDEAGRIMREALEITRSLFGDASPGVAILTGQLGLIHYEKKEFHTAVNLYRESLDKMYAIWPGGHFRIGTTEHNLGRCLTELGEYAEAERFLLSGFESISEVRSIDDPFTVRAVESIVKLYRAWERVNDAIKYERLIGLYE
jgi:eukaryotic-like serine/threonine-protein kinase